MRPVAVELGGTTRPAVCLGRAAIPIALPLGDVELGFVTLHLGSLSTPSARGSVSLTLLPHHGPVSAPDCRLLLDPSVAAPGWDACRIAVARRAKQASVQIRFEGAAGDVCVSSPILHAGVSSPRPSVFVFLADTLRSDPLSLYDPRMPLGESLQRLAQDGVLFAHARAPSSWTRTSVATLLTGLSPGDHGVLGRLDVLPADVTTLAETLQEHGYVTLAWSTNPNVLPMWGFDQGFDAFTDLGAFAWMRDKTDVAAVLREVAEAVRHATGPTLYYVHLMDPHGPYMPPRRDLKAVKSDRRTRAGVPPPAPGFEAQAEEKAERFWRYLAEIRHMDRRLGTFFDFLRSRGIYDDALILFASDHGEEFFDHGGEHHGRTLYEEMLRVPVILKLPQQADAGSRIAAPVGLAELFATVLEALGIRIELPGEVEAVRAARDSRPDAPRPHVAVLKLDRHHKAAITDGRWKLVIDRLNDRAELFDLQEDPGERSDLYDRRSAEAERLRGILDSTMASRDKGWHIRACGGAKSSTLALRVEGLRGDSRALGLEEGDSVTLQEKPDGTGALEARLQLSSRRATRKVFGRLASVPILDEDEIVLPAIAAEGITVQSLGGGPLRFSWGRYQQQQQAAEIRANASLTGVEIGPGENVDCADDRGQGRRPYLRIWWIRPVAALAEAEVDAETAERLRRLGYDW